MLHFLVCVSCQVMKAKVGALNKRCAAFSPVGGGDALRPEDAGQPLPRPPRRLRGRPVSKAHRPRRGGGHSCGCGLVSTVSWGVGVALKLAPPPPAMRVAHRLLSPSVFLFGPGTCTWMSPQKSIFRCHLVA